MSYDEFEQLTGFLYLGDFLFLAALATIILKLQLEKSTQGFSAKTQSVYGVVLCTRNIDLIFVHGELFWLIYCVFRKVTYISCIIYIVVKIMKTSKKDPTCQCNQDAFWVEALVLPSIVITAVYHYGNAPEEVLWSFSTYLESVAMVPQLYLLWVRGKGDSYLPLYIALMAAYTLANTLAYCLNAYLYGKMETVWAACKCVQLAIYIWYIFIPREPVLPVVNCEERRRRPTMFLRQESLLAQTLLKNNSAQDLQVYVLPSPTSSASPSSSRSPSITELPETPVEDPCSCCKNNPALKVETITLKVPRLLRKQCKYETARMMDLSLPSTPEVARRSILKATQPSTYFRSLSRVPASHTRRLMHSRSLSFSDGTYTPQTPEINDSGLNLKSPLSIPSNQSLPNLQMANRKPKKTQSVNQAFLPSNVETIRSNGGKKSEYNMRSYSPKSSLKSTITTSQNHYKRKRPPLLKLHLPHPTSPTMRRADNLSPTSQPLSPTSSIESPASAKLNGLKLSVSSNSPDKI